MTEHDNPAILLQAAIPAARLIPIRWPHSQKLIGYYDLDTHALIYQDARGRVLDRVDLAVYRIAEGRHNE